MPHRLQFAAAAAATVCGMYFLQLRYFPGATRLMNSNSRSQLLFVLCNVLLDCWLAKMRFSLHVYLLIVSNALQKKCFSNKLFILSA